MLVVDDIELNQRVLARQLEVFGMECVAIDDGFRAIGEIERAVHLGRAFDVVILDHMMPGISGDALAARIRKTPDIAETKLIIASSAGTYGLARDAQKVVDVVLTKPIREQSLLDGFARIFSHPTTQDRAEPTREVAESPDPAAASSLRVLLAEDHRINQRLAVMLLEGANHRVDIAENGQEAVAAVLKHDYDVVLMDVQMPVLDGVQATQKIRALPPPKGAVPIIALTAHAMAGAREEYLSAGMDDYLSKPLEPDALFAALAKASAKSTDAESATGSVCAESAEAPASVGKIFDPVRIGTLQRVLPEGGFTDFVGMFRDSLRTVADRTERLIVADKIDELMHEAHGLAGTAGNVGAIWVSHCARELEQACKSADAASIARAAKALKQAVPETQCELERWLGVRCIDAPLTEVT